MHEEKARPFRTLFCLPQSLCILHVAAGHGRQPGDPVYRVGGCWTLFIPADRLLVQKQEYNKAANKAFIMNRIGDLAFLIAIFWLIARVGTVSFDELFTAVNLAKLSASDITVITLLLFIGATGKSAQIPLYTWLPGCHGGSHTRVRPDPRGYHGYQVKMR